MAKIHKLKTWPKYFRHIEAGNKLFEYRLNDREFCFGDTVVLKEWDPDRPYIDKIPGPLGPPKGYTGKELTFKIGYILPVPNTNYVVFSLMDKNYAN